MGTARSRLALAAAAVGFVSASGLLYVADRPIGRAQLSRFAQMSAGTRAPACSRDAGRADLDDPPPFFTAVPGCR